MAITKYHFDLLRDANSDDPRMVASKIKEKKAAIAAAAAKEEEKRAAAAAKPKEEEQAAPTKAKEVATTGKQSAAYAKQPISYGSISWKSYGSRSFEDMRANNNTSRKSGPRQNQPYRQTNQYGVDIDKIYEEASRKLRDQQDAADKKLALEKASRSRQRHKNANNGSESCSTTDEPDHHQVLPQEPVVPDVVKVVDNVKAEPVVEKVKEEPVVSSTLNKDKPLEHVVSKKVKAKKESSEYVVLKKEEEKKETMTLEEYQKNLEEKRKAILALKATTSEERKVAGNSEFDNMQQLPLKKEKENEEISVSKRGSSSKKGSGKPKRFVEHYITTGVTRRDGYYYDKPSASTSASSSHTQYSLVNQENFPKLN